MFKNDSNHNFLWAQTLFHDNITISLPPIEKGALIDTLSSSITSSTGIAKAISKSAVLESLVVDQLDQQAGFDLTGGLQVSYPSGIPKVRVDVGYLGLTGTLGSVQIGQIQLPTGLLFHPSQNGTRIHASALLPASSESTSKEIQSLVDHVMNSINSTELYAGVTGFVFGQSLQNHLVTFGRIVVDVSIFDIERGLSTFNNGASLLSLGDGSKASVSSLDLKVQDSHSVGLSCDVSLSNPTIVDLSIGAILVGLQLDHTNILQIEVSPIEIKSKSTNQLKVVVKAFVFNSANGSSHSVASLVRGVLNHETVHVPIGITHFSMTGNTPQSKIVLFEPIYLGFDSKLVISNSRSLLSLVDLSAIIPSSKQILDETHPLLKYALVDSSQGNGMIAVGSDVSYNNPVPVSINVPYASVDLSIDGLVVFQVGVVGIEIDRVTG